MGKDLNIRDCEGTEQLRKKMIKRTVGVFTVLTGVCLAMFLGGCGKKVKEPVTVTLCHVYGGLRSGRQYKTGNTKGSGCSGAVTQTKTTYRWF